jgi:hypothetical protein
LPKHTLHNEFTAIIERDGKWYIGYCPEIPGANGQGKTVEECKKNLLGSHAATHARQPRTGTSSTFPSPPAGLELLNGGRPRSPISLIADNIFFSRRTGRKPLELELSRLGCGRRLLPYG